MEYIRDLVDIELGYAKGAGLSLKKFKIFLFISQQKKLMGCVFAEEITQVRFFLSNAIVHLWIGYILQTSK